MNKDKDIPFEKKLEEVAKTLEFKNKNERSEIIEEKLSKAQKLLVQYIEEKKEMNQEYYWPIIFSAIKSLSESKIISGLMLVPLIASPIKSQMPTIIELTEIFFQNYRILKHPLFVNFGAKVFGIILKRFSSCVIQQVDQYCVQSITEIMRNDEKKCDDRLYSYSILKQILKNKYYIVLKEIQKIDTYEMFKIISNEKTNNQAVSVEFCFIFAKQISKLEKEEQKNYFLTLAMRILKDMSNQKSEHFINLTYKMFKIAFSSLSKSLFSNEDCIQIYDVILEHLKSIFQKKSLRVWDNVCQMVPEMITYNAALFVESLYINKYMDLLVKTVDEFSSKEPDFSRNWFQVISKILSFYNEQILSSFSMLLSLKIIKLIDNWNKKKDEKHDMYYALNCLKMCLKHIRQLNLTKEETLNEFLDGLLIHNFSEITLEILDLMHKSNDADFNRILEIKLKYTISIILKNDVNAFDDENQASPELPVSLLNTSMIQNSFILQPIERGFLEKMFCQKINAEIEQENLNESMKRMISLNGIDNRTGEFTNMKISFFKTKKNELLKTFVTNLEKFYKEDKKIAKTSDATEKRIAVALEALAKFDFGQKTNEKRTIFIKNTVFTYLESNSIELRKIAARIVFHLSSDQNSPLRSNLSLANKTIQGIIDKMLFMAVGDPNDSVREETLCALNAKSSKHFVSFLVREDILKQLIVLAYDVNHKIQKQSILLLEKIIPSFPEILLRFDQIIFRAISFLSNNINNLKNEDRAYIQILFTIGANAMHIIEEKIPVLTNLLIKIFENFMKKFKNDNQDNFCQYMLKDILKSLTIFLDFHPIESRRYFDTCTKIFVENYSFFSEEIFQKYIKLLIVLTRNSGYQLIFVIKYDIFRLILEFLDRNGSNKLRILLVRMIGTLGAIDPAILIKIEELRRQGKIHSQMSNLQVTKIIQKLRKNKFNFQKHLFEKKQDNEDPCKDVFDKFQNNISLMQKKVNPPYDLSLQIKNLPELKKIFTDLKSITQNFKPITTNQFSTEKQFFKHIQSDEDLQKIVVTITIDVLFETLKNETQEVIISECLESLQKVVVISGRTSFVYNDVIFYSLIDSFEYFTSMAFKLMLLKSLRHLIKVTNADLMKNSDCVLRIIDLVTSNLSEEDLQLELFGICHLLIDNKSILRHRLKKIVIVIVMLIDAHPFMNNIQRAFEVMYRLDNPEYLFLITPVFIKLLVEIQSKNHKLKTEVTKLIINYFATIKNTNHFRHHLGNIVRTCILLIQSSDEQVDFIQLFLIDVIRSLKEKTFDFLPILNPYLRTIPSYIKIVKDLEEKGFIEDDFARQISMNDKKVATHNEIDLETTLQTSFAGNEFNYEIIKSVFLTDQLSKSDMDWEDWFLQFKIKLILHSPSKVLFACKNLRFNMRVMNGLFKPSFLVFWSELKDIQKNQILKGFDLIISTNSHIPLKIHREILSLIESMTLNNKFGLVLDVIKLAEFANKCHSQSKAIFFKELEFKNNPESAIKSLLLLYKEAGYIDAAEGLLEYSQGILSLPVKEKLYQWLGKWDLLSNLPVYRESISMQIRCSVAHSDWDLALQQISELSKKMKNQQINFELANFATKSAYHLSKWDDLKKTVIKTTSDSEFYNCVLSIHNKKYDEAKNYADEFIQIIEKNSQSLANYVTSYEKLIKLHKIVELQEIIHFRNRFDALSENDLYQYTIPIEMHKQKRQLCLNHLIDSWEDKLSSIQPTICWFEDVISTRSFIADKCHFLKSNLKLADLFCKQENFTIYNKLIHNLENDSSMQKNHLFLLKLSQIEGEFQMEKIDFKSAIEEIEQLGLDSNIDKSEKRKLYKKVGNWIVNNETYLNEHALGFFEKYLNEAQDDYKLWHYFAISNYQMIKNSEKRMTEVNSKYLLNAFHSFACAISLDNKFNGRYTMQDLLRLLELWYDYHDVISDSIRINLEQFTKLVPYKFWAMIIRPIIAKLEQKETFLIHVKSLLRSLAQDFPQHVIFPLLVSQKSDNKPKVRLVAKILKIMAQSHPKLVSDATIFGEELIRVSVLFEEMWYNGYCEMYKFRNESKMRQVYAILSDLFEKTFFNHSERSFNEISFFKKNGRYLHQAREFFTLFTKTQNELFFLQTWDILHNFFKELEIGMKCDIDCFYLENTSPQLFEFKNSHLFVPGTLKRNTTKNYDIRVACIDPVLKLLKSKRRPRKLSLFGSNGKEYSFLLKGNEDLRLDERMIQLFNLINDLFKTSKDVPSQALEIATFNVLPLSYDCGLISWVEGCDTIFELIKDYRIKVKLNINHEKNLYSQFNENYNGLSRIKKLEVFRFVCENTKCDDLKNIFWQKSPSAEIWLANRHRYICSLAVMSMVGYIVGLGDRHLMNIMIEKCSGRVIHIDFGDCFESAMLREKLPEKVPFRLTRILVNAMEACQTEGTFKKVCQTVMNTLRSNKDVILAVLEEFICDPILTWKIIENQQILDDSKLDSEENFSLVEKPRLSTEFYIKNQSKVFLIGNESEVQLNIDKGTKDVRLNIKAIEALNRIKCKLAGTEFTDSIVDYKSQVDRLIAEATSSENICQAYIGWNPFL